MPMITPSGLPFETMTVPNMLQRGFRTPWLASMLKHAVPAQVADGRNRERNVRNGMGIASDFTEKLPKPAIMKKTNDYNCVWPGCSVRLR